MAIVVVTGSSTGIGFATAEALARVGHDVIATMRDPEGAPSLADLARRESLTITVLPMDVDSDASVAATMARILSAHGRIDVLVNNAGVGRIGSVEETPLDAFRQVMETNYFGALRCIQAVLPSMRASRSGVIVNVTSVSGRIAPAGHSAYSASKWALEALSECLAAEVKAYGVRVAIVEPGVIATPIFGKREKSVPAGLYPHSRRLQALFSASLERPVPASFVGDAIRDIVASDLWTLRYPVVRDAESWLRWRASVSDEDFVARGASDDDSWCRHVEAHLGLDVRKYLGEPA
jgi:NAD(P)-dependent dehydrogenase (short-subunit alcohol dehydrogenase family)